MFTSSNTSRTRFFKVGNKKLEHAVVGDNRNKYHYEERRSRYNNFLQ